MGQIYKFFDKHEDLLQEKLKKTACGLDRRMQLTYLPENGYFRAITAIIFLVAAALLLIAAGVIGFQKSEKLNKYLASINIKK